MNMFYKMGNFIKFYYYCDKLEICHNYCHDYKVC